MGSGFAIGLVVGVMTRDESKIKWTIYVFIYMYIEIRNKQVAPAKKIFRGTRKDLQLSGNH